MRLTVTRILIIIFVGTLLLSALLTPWVYEAMLASNLGLKYPFSRVFDRVAMLVVLFFVLLFRKQLKLDPLFAFLKQGSWKGRLSAVALGFAVSLIASILVFPVFVLSGQLLWLDANLTQMLAQLFRSVPAALLVSLIEEGFFRALLFVSLRQRWALAPAVLLSSLLYALAHFITPDKTFVYQEFSALVGFDYLMAVLRRMLLPGTWQVFVGFAFVGATLALVIERSRSLYLCIGLHAGWVVALKLLNNLTDLASSDVSAAGIGGRYFLLSQPFTWGSVVIVLFAALFLSSRLKGLRGVSENT